MSVLMPDKVSVRGPARFVQGDSRTQMVWFTVPRYSDGVDLSRLGWTIHICNAAGTEDWSEPNETPEVRSDKILISWLVRGAATAVVGDMTFSLRGAGNDAAGNPMRWCSGDEIRTVYAAQESFSQSDSEAATSAVERLVQLVQVELPAVQKARDEAKAAAEYANAAAVTASNAAAAANTAAKDVHDAVNAANNAAVEAIEAAENAHDKASAANAAAGAATAAAAGVGAAIESALTEAKESGEFDGPQGPKGDKGDKGDTGATGPRGAQGERGYKGDKGDKGDTGAAGKNGADGEDGYTPVRGVDYWTEEDQQQIIDQVSAVAAAGIENTVSGDVIAVSDSLDAPLRGLTLFGKTTQNGTPAPDAPVALESAGGDGSVDVTVEGGESVTISTPNGLPGIPVTSGGNYTDEKGQQWVCDEIDLARDVYVQRVAKLALDGTEIGGDGRAWYKSSMHADAPGNILRFAIDKFLPANIVSGSGITFPGFCTHFTPINANLGYMGQTIGVAITLTGMLNFYIELANTNEFKAWLDTQKAAGTPVTVYYILPELIETKLPDGYGGDYAALHTFKPSTTVTNDSGAGMQIGYSADTKAYIDNKFAELAAVLAAKV